MKLSGKIIHSIIVVNRNGYDLLRDFMTSLKEHTDLASVELIVFDNHSTDQSLALVRSYESDLPVTIIESHNNKSYSYANNAAVHVAQGEYLIFANNDLLFTKDWLPLLTKKMCQNTDVGSVGPVLVYPKHYDDIGGTVQCFGITFKRDLANGYCRPHNDNVGRGVQDITQDQRFPALTGALLMVSKERFNEVGGFDEKYFYTFEDVDLCLKFVQAGYYNLGCSDVRIYHQESITQKKYTTGDHYKKILNSRQYFKRKWNDVLEQEIYLTSKDGTVNYSNENPLEVIRVSEQKLQECKKLEMKLEQSIYINTNWNTGVLKVINAIGFGIFNPIACLRKFTSRDQK